MSNACGKQGRRRYNKLSGPVRHGQVGFLQRDFRGSLIECWLSVLKSDSYFSCVLLKSQKLLNWKKVQGYLDHSMAKAFYKLFPTDAFLLLPRFLGRIYPFPLLSYLPKLPKASVQETSPVSVFHSHMQMVVQ